MDKENILAKAREEKLRGKEYEYGEQMYSGVIGYTITLALCCVFTFIELFANGSFHFGMLSIGATAVGVDILYLGTKMKNKGKVVLGSFILLAAVIFIVFYIVMVVVL